MHCQKAAQKAMELQYQISIPAGKEDFTSRTEGAEYSLTLLCVAPTQVSHSSLKAHYFAKGTE